MPDRPKEIVSERVADLGKQPHSVRLFPKFMGANAYRMTGIAACCDWVLFSDDLPPHVHLEHNGIDCPETVFVSLRSPTRAVDKFFRDVLPMIAGQFILITGSEDVTIPRQIDTRWPMFADDQSRQIHSLQEDERLLAWFAENIDTRATGLHSLPTGMVPPAVHPVELSDRDRSVEPDSVLCAHRVRDGIQWKTRRVVTEMCRKASAPGCSLIEHELPFEEYVALLNRHAFVLCVEGGGLDPSPKAWTAMMNGCIPIIRESPATEAYRELPVAFTPEWDERVIDPGWLGEHRARLAVWFDTDEGRSRLRHRLSLAYWWEKVASCLPEHGANRQ